MKLTLLFLLATLSGCVVVKERVRTEYKQLPPKIIERHYIIVPDEAIPKEQSEEEKIKERYKYA